MSKKTERFPLIAIGLFALAAFLIGFGGINAVRAAPRIESADYRAQVQLTSIHVALVENGKVVQGDNELLTDLLERSGDTELKVGKTYDEVLSVRNANHPGESIEGSAIDEYVRVSVYRYWTDATGKAVDLDPSLIKLNFVTDKGWTIDEEASTPERTVLYYKDILEEGDETTPFADSITIDSAASTAMGGNTYLYKGVKCNIKAVADAVQTHNGEQAMKSAWGRTNTVE